MRAWLLTYLLNALWQAPLALAAGWAAARLARRLGPGAEHRVWVAALLGESALPALGLVEWGRLWAWLAAAGAGEDAGGASVTVAMQAGTVGGGITFPEWLQGAAALLYGATLVYFAARLGWQLLRLRRLRKSAEPLRLGGAAARFWTECAARFGTGRARVLASADVAAPVTLGTRAPWLLLPAAMMWAMDDDATMQAVLAHECAHMARRDFAKNLLYEVATLPVRFHPACWLARARVTETREMVCDRMAAALNGRVRYGNSLLRLAARLAEGGPLEVPQAVGIFDSNDLERRIMKLAERQLDVRGARRAAMVMACVALGAATGASALALRMHVAAATGAAVAEENQKPLRVHVAAGVMAQQLDHHVNPVYPPVAKKARVQGTVVLKATIGKDGTMQALRAVSGPTLLQQSALDAVKQWTYKPYLLNGEPVEVETQVNVIYSLGKKK